MDLRDHRRRPHDRRREPVSGSAPEGKRGLIEASWGVSPKGRRAKYHGLTYAGGVELGNEQKRWNDYVNAVGKISAVVGNAK